MNPLKPLTAAIVCVGVLAAPAGAAPADDATLTASVTKWSLRIAKPAKQLSTKVSASTTPDQALVFLRSFTRTADSGKAAIGTQRPETTTGHKLKALAQAAFAKFGDAGRLLIQAVNGIKAGKSQQQLAPSVNRAVKLANQGSAQLNQVANLIPRLIGG